MADGPVVATTGGDIQGRERRGVQIFAGIPYAAPPVGARRFAPPEPVQPWTGVRDGRRFGPAAPQLPGEGLTNQVPVRWDEDCLTCNVVTPAADDGARPVYVWIHGGAYLHGQGATPWYDGTSFALGGDIVVVTVNYRLGALGFCRLGPHFPGDDGMATAGLHGTMDQIAALRWVQDNIAAFGGDPNRVTIGGESAGAFSVANLLVSPTTSGLFHRAIAQSGAAHHVNDPTDGETAAGALLAELSQPSADELRAVPAIEILHAQQRVIAAYQHGDRRGTDPFYPVWGGEILPRPPLELMAAGAGADVPVLTGTNEDEVALWGVTGLDEDRMRRYVARLTDDPDGMIDVYRRRLAEAPAGWVACAIGTDHVFRVPAVRMADARHAHGATTFMYRFSWDSRAFDGMFGAAHALEIPFTFNTLDRAGTDVFLGPGDRPDGLARTIHDAWTAFIVDGEPATPTLGQWPAYTPDTRAVMDLDDDCRLLHDPQPDELALWEGVR